METKENRIKRLALYCKDKPIMDTTTIDDFYQLEKQREVMHTKGIYQLILLLTSVAFIAIILVVSFGKKDYCTPDNSKESKIVQQMQLDELKTTLLLQNKEWKDSLQNYIDSCYPVKIYSRIKDLPTNYAIIDNNGKVIYQPKKRLK